MPSFRLRKFASLITLLSAIVADAEVSLLVLSPRLTVVVLVENIWT